MKTIEQELIEDIKKGTIKHSPDAVASCKQQQVQQGATNVKGNGEKEGGFATNLPAHLLKGHTRDTHNPISHDMHATHQSLINQQKPATSLASSVS
jgi:hypothetical protein